MPRALVTNDDGVWSLGLRLLASSLASSGFEVSIYAPLANWSGSSKALGRAGNRRAFRLEIGGFEAVAVDAPPAFCVSLALLSEGPYDIVVSGVNDGPNIGVHDILSSGTIGAVIEAALRGVKGVAVSSYCGDSSSSYDASCMKPAADVAAFLARIVSESGTGFDAVSINAPRPPWKGVVVTYPVPGAPRLRAWVKGFTAYIEPKNHRLLYSSAPKGSDGWALVNGYLSLVLIRVTSRSLEWIPESDSEASRLAGLVESFAREAGYLE